VKVTIPAIFLDLKKANSEICFSFRLAEVRAGFSSIFIPF
jgi:hypothetical protein